MVRSVRSTPGICRMRVAMEAPIFSVVARLAPSGARTWTSNCDSSSCGRKVLSTIMKRGTIETNTASMTSTTTQRWARECLSSQR
jgi:hypothetical protein